MDGDVLKPVARSDLEWGGPSEGAAVAESGCILRTVVGSQVHGLVQAGTDDRDEMAITIEPPEYVMGLRSFEHWTHRTQPEGEPSGPGDLDLVVYSLRKFCRLALKGSPTVLLPLFAPPEHTLICTEAGRALRAQTDLFIASDFRSSFLGYLQAQRKSLLATGKARDRELSETHGYDTKYAMHALRIGYQGLQLAKEGVISLPVPEPGRTRLMEIRGGSVPLDDVLLELDGLIDKLRAAPVPHMDPPPELQLEQWLIGAYRDHWQHHWTPPGLE